MQYSEEKKYHLGDKDELTAREKAAILMVALGEDAAGGRAGRQGAVRRGLAPHRRTQGVHRAVEDAAACRSERLEGAEDHQKHQREDQAVLDCGRAALVVP